MGNLINLLIYIAIYFFTTLPLFIIAKKCEHEYAWLAWVPLADLWLMCDMAAIPLYWAILSVIISPLFPILLIALWWRISENTNKPGWLGFLMVVPLVKHTWFNSAGAHE